MLEEGFEDIGKGLGRASLKVRIFARRLRAFIGRSWIVERTPIHIVGSEGSCDSPIIVVGVHRSGTSLLRRVLDSHSRIACPPETFFLAKFAEIMDDRLCREGMIGMGYNEDARVAMLRRAATSFHEGYMVAKGKVRWADKTPQYISVLPALEKLLPPGTQFVWIHRHPLDVAYSIWSRRWELVVLEDPFCSVVPNRSDRPSVASVSHYVRRALSRAAEFMAAVPKGRGFVLRYSELAKEPEDSLRRLCAFLGEAWEPRMLVHDQISHDKGTEDPIVQGVGGFEFSGDNWQAWSAPQISDAWSVLRETCESLGYNGPPT